MSFDFGALAKMKKDIDNKEEYHTGVPKPKKSTKLKKEKVEVENIDIVERSTVEEVVPTGKSKDSSFEDKLDKWIEMYKGTPKVMYDDLNFICTYEEDTETVTMLDKVVNESVSFVSKEFFEYAIFATKTRPEKAQVLKDKYTELTGKRLGRLDVIDTEMSIEDEVTVEEVIENNIEEPIEDFILPDEF